MFKTLPSNAGGAGLIPGQGAKIPHALWPKIQNTEKQKQYCNKFNKDFLKFVEVSLIAQDVSSLDICCMGA